MNSESPLRFSSCHIVARPRIPASQVQAQDTPSTFSACASSSTESCNGKSAILLEMDPALAPPRRGGHCKISALAYIDAFYAEMLGCKKIPLLSEKGDKLSIRKIAKKHNSVQGEVLQRQDLCEIAKGIGYKTQILQCPDLENFRDTIYHCLKENTPPLVVFPVDPNGRPRTEANPPESCEHGALIVGLDPDTSEVTLAHWQKTYAKIPLSELHNSMQNLQPTRSQESYLTTWKKDGTRSLANSTNRKNYKYPDVSNEAFTYKAEELLKSIKPAPGTGFKNCLFLFTPNLSSRRWKDISPEKQLQFSQQLPLSKYNCYETNLRSKAHWLKVQSYIREQCYNLYESEYTKGTVDKIDNYLNDLQTEHKDSPYFPEQCNNFRKQMWYLNGLMGNSPDQIKENFGTIIEEIVNRLDFRDHTPPAGNAIHFQQWLQESLLETDYLDWLQREMKDGSDWAQP